MNRKLHSVFTYKNIKLKVAKRLIHLTSRKACKDCYFVGCSTYVIDANGSIVPFEDSFSCSCMGRPSEITGDCGANQRGKDKMVKFVKV